MIHDTRHNFLARPVRALLSVVALVLGTGWAATTWAQTTRPSAHGSPTQQALYSEYRGVRIGMNAQEVRTKLGEPSQKVEDLDLYSFSDKETAQISYDALHKVQAVSVDYLGGIGAPDYKLVVGPDVEVNADGAIYKQVFYKSLGLWVYYNRSAGAVPVVTITIQKSM
jgi:hypothetical protein